MIRAIAIKDIDAMVHIHKQNFDKPWNNEVLLTMLQTSTIRAFGVFKNELVSFIILRIIDYEAEILTLVTAVENTGNGYATELLSHNLRFLKNNQVKVLFLEVRATNKIAIKVYDKFGFKKISKRINYYKTHHGYENAIVLKLDL